MGALTFGIRAAMLAGIGLLGVAVLQPRAANAAPPPISVFEMPVLGGHERLAIQQLRSGQFDAAQSLSTKITKRYPQMPLAYYLLATLLGRQGKIAAALDSLETAIDNGLPQADRLKQ